MDREDWKQVYRALLSASTRLTAELGKHTDVLRAAGVSADGTNQHTAALFADINEARLQLCQLQKQVNDGQINSSFIQTVATQMSAFTDFLSSLKARQRQQYAALLQQEQELLQDLQAFPVAFEVDAPTDIDNDEGQCVQAGHTHSHQHSEQSAVTACHQADAVQRSHRRDSPSKLHKQRFSSAGPAATASHLSSQQSSSTLLPEVVAYDQYLAKHGATGGWHPDDHNIFINILRSNRGDYSAAVPAAADALHMYTRQAILSHCRWHADLLELDMRRRVALVNWRAEKNAAKAALRVEAAALQDDKSAGLQLFHDQSEKEARQLQKQRIVEWKQQKRAAEEQQAQLAAMRQKQEKDRQQKEMQEKRAALKQHLQEMKAAKQQEAAVQAMQLGKEQNNSVKSLSGEDSQQQKRLQRLKERSNATLQRRQLLLAAKLEKQEAREKAQQQLLAELETVKPRVDRDPSRLLSATAAAAARVAKSTEEAEMTAEGGKGCVGRGSIPSGFVLHLGHKAVPAWASGMR